MACKLVCDNKPNLSESKDAITKRIVVNEEFINATVTDEKN